MPLLDQNLLLLLDRLGHVQWNLEDTGDNVCGSQSQPLRERNVLDSVTLVDLDPHQVFRGRGVLNVVTYDYMSEAVWRVQVIKHTTVVREQGRIAGREIKRPGVGVADKNRGLALSLVKVQPLGGVGVPVQLPEPAGLQGDHGRRNGRGDGERLGVDDPQRASVPGHVLERMLLGVVDVRGVARQQPVASRDFLGRECRVENVRVRRGDAAEHVLGDVEVLGKDGLGRVGDPIVDVERGASTYISTNGRNTLSQPVATYPTASKLPSSKTRRNSLSSSRPAVQVNTALHETKILAKAGTLGD